VIPTGKFNGDDEDPMSQDAPVSESAYEDTWREINDVLNDVARLSQSDVDSDQFFTDFIDVCVQTLAGIAGAVWLKQPDDSLALRYHSNYADTGLSLAADSEDDRRHALLLKEVVADSTGKGVALPPHIGSEGESSAVNNPTPHLLLISPIAINRETTGVVEVFQRSNASHAASQGFLRFLDSVAQLAADFLRNVRFRSLQSQADVAARFEQFTQRIHDGLNVRRTAMMIANEGRNVIGCDRVSVALMHGRRCRMIAVSGVDSIDRRSNLIRAAEDVMTRVARTRQDFWYQDEHNSQPDKLPSQIAKPLDRFFDDSPARELGVIPLIKTSHKAGFENDRPANSGKAKAKAPIIVGVLMVERFEPVEDSLFSARVDSVGQQSALALGNATEHSNLPFLSLIRILQAIGFRFSLKQLPRTVVVLSLLVGAILALVLIPADFTIDGRGELQPAERRGVFATATGVVEVLSEKLAGDNPMPDVEEGDVLIQLADSKVEFEFARIDGALKTAQASLLTKQIQRRNLKPNDPSIRDLMDQLSAEETELEVEIKGLEAQLAVLVRQQKDLSLRSPITGRVMTWEPAKVLGNKPVQQGERLLEIAKVDGQWVLEIRVPDQNIGYVKLARRELKPKLDVSFVLATNPEVTFKGTVLSIAEETRHHEQDGPTVLVTVAIDRESIPVGQLRMGATVIPHIHCGERSIGFVWFHEVIHAIKTRLLF
jgi:hypothetical protein